MSVYQGMGPLAVFDVVLMVNIHCIDFDPFPATTYSKCFSGLNYDSSNGLNYNFLMSIIYVFIKHCLNGLEDLNNGSVDLCVWLVSCVACLTSCTAAVSSYLVVIAIVCPLFSFFFKPPNSITRCQ